MSINSPWDEKQYKSECKRLSVRIPVTSSSSSQVAVTTVPQREVTPITGGLAVPTTHTTTYTTVKTVSIQKKDSGPFYTADDAARHFANIIYPSSQYIRHEYASMIYSELLNNQTVFYHTSPNKGSPHGVDIKINDIPDGATAVAYIHTHPNSTFFSDADISIANDNNINAYMADHDYNLHRYNVYDQEEIIVGTFSPIELTEDEKVHLENQFRESWNNHIVNGVCSDGFDCANMPWPTP